MIVDYTKDPTPLNQKLSVRSSARNLHPKALLLGGTGLVADPSSGRAFASGDVVTVENAIIAIVECLGSVVSLARP